jgi:hypothetical protein
MWMSKHRRISRIIFLFVIENPGVLLASAMFSTPAAG